MDSKLHPSTLIGVVIPVQSINSHHSPFFSFSSFLNLVGGHSQSAWFTDYVGVPDSQCPCPLSMRRCQTPATPPLSPFR